MNSQPVRPRTRLDPEIRREQILAAADHVLQGREPTDVTFEEIADAAGVSRALVYNYFGDRGGLLAAVYLRSFARLDDELNSAVDRTVTASERIRDFVRCYLRFAQSNAGGWGLLASTGAIQHPAVQNARRKRFDRIARSWGGGADAALVVRAVVGLLEAATIDWLDQRDADLERTTDLLATLLWKGMSSLGRFDVALPDRTTPVGAA